MRNLLTEEEVELKMKVELLKKVMLLEEAKDNKGLEVKEVNKDHHENQEEKPESPENANQEKNHLVLYLDLSMLQV